MGGRAGCEVLIWRHFDRAMDEKCSNTEDEVAHRGARSSTMSYLRTYDPSGRGVRARAVGRQFGKRTNSRLHAGMWGRRMSGKGSSREKAPAGLRVDDCRPFSRRCEYSFIQR